MTFEEQQAFLEKSFEETQKGQEDKGAFEFTNFKNSCQNIRYAVNKLIIKTRGENNDKNSRCA